jgi:hypothetical protein
VVAIALESFHDVFEMFAVPGLELQLDLDLPKVLMRKRPLVLNRDHVRFLLTDDAQDACKGPGAVADRDREPGEPSFANLRSLDNAIEDAEIDVPS